MGDQNKMELHFLIFIPQVFFPLLFRPFSCKITKTSRNHVWLLFLVDSCFWGDAPPHFFLWFLYSTCIILSSSPCCNVGLMKLNHFWDDPFGKLKKWDLPPIALTSQFLRPPMLLRGSYLAWSIHLTTIMQTIYQITSR